jgi:hypothetical protein
MQEINPYFWYSERKLDFTPNHFVITKTPVTDQSLVWVYNALSGRFSITNIHENSDVLTSVILFYQTINIAFEDPKEAMLYELTWS